MTEQAAGHPLLTPIRGGTPRMIALLGRQELDRAASPYQLATGQKRSRMDCSQLERAMSLASGVAGVLAWGAPVIAVGFGGCGARSRSGRVEQAE